MSREIVVSREIVANCLNCEYAFYDPNDIERLQGCRVMFMSRGDREDLDINRLARMVIGEGLKGICEHYQPVELLKNQIVYKIEEKTWQI